MKLVHIRKHELLLSKSMSCKFLQTAASNFNFIWSLIFTFCQQFPYFFSLLAYIYLVIISFFLQFLSFFIVFNLLLWKLFSFLCNFKFSVILFDFDIVYSTHLYLIFPSLNINSFYFLWSLDISSIFNYNYKDQLLLWWKSVFDSSLRKYNDLVNNLS